MRVRIMSLMALVYGIASAQPALQRTDIQVNGQFGSFLGGSANAITGDFNQDGRPDLVIGGLPGVSVLINSGGGAFTQRSQIPTISCGPIVAADFNRDGKLDLFLSEVCDFNGRILLGHGDGTFDPPLSVPNCNRAVAGDLNGDGIPDLACNDASTTSARILLGNGDGTFRPGSSQSGPTQSSPMIIADFNRDGKLDIAAQLFDGLTVYPGRGDGTFDPPIVTRAAVIDSLRTGDFNHDGILDLATGTQIFLGKGEGSFAAPRTYFTSNGMNPPLLAIADLNGDGNPDLVTGSYYAFPVKNIIRVFLGKGDGTMSDPIEYTVGQGPFLGASADFDGDGRQDLVTLNLASNTVSLLLNKGAATPVLARAVSAASGAAIVAANSLATLYAPTGSTNSATAGAQPWPDLLGGVSLQIRDSAGSTFLAPLLYVDGAQINFQVPDKAATGEATLSLLRGANVLPIGTMQVAAFAPAIFLANPEGLTASAFYRRVASDGTETSGPLYQCSGQGLCQPVPANPSAHGSFVTFYGTGFRNASLSNVQCLLYGSRVSVESAGPQGTPGVDQITIRLPEQDDDFWDEVPGADVVVSVGGVLANRVWMQFSRKR